jgi:ATP-dependent RNA helicase DDX19/DBP5
MSELVDKALPTAASDGSVEKPEPEPEVLKAADAANEAEGEKVSPVEAEAEKETEEETQSAADITTQLSTLSVTRSRADEIAATDHLIIESIDSFGHASLDMMPKPILEALELDMNLKRPSPVQALTIPQILKGNSVIAQAQTGSGKTIAFSVGIISRLELTSAQCQALCLAPTRELADQIVTDALVPLGGRMKPELKVEKAIPGLQEIGRGAKSSSHVIVGTPGTVKNWLSRKYFSLKTVKILVLDEADFMVKDSQYGATFRKEVNNIRAGCKEAQMLLFSATYPEGSLDYCRSLAPRAVEVTVPKNNLMLKEITQVRMRVPVGGKLNILQDLYEILGVQSSIVFLETKKEATEVTKMMNEAGFTVSTLHGDIEGIERDKVMNEFREQKTKFLITTNVLARGVDVPAVSVVVNYCIPRLRERAAAPMIPDSESYLHRIGRTGRFGRKGIAITFIETDADDADLKTIEEEYSGAGARMTVAWSCDDIGGLKTAGVA